MIIQVPTKHITSGNVESPNVSTSYTLQMIAKITGEETMRYIKECNVYQRSWAQSTPNGGCKIRDVEDQITCISSSYKQLYNFEGIFFHNFLHTKPKI